MTLERKTVLLTIPFGMSARNVLRTDIYRVLKEKCRVVILSRLSRDENFLKEFNAPGVAFYDLPPLGGWWRSRFRFQVQTLWTFRYGKKTGSENLRRRRERLKTAQKFEYYRLTIMTWLMDALGLWKVILATRRLVLRHPYYAGIFDKEKPDLVVTTSPLVTEEDLLVTYLARRRGIPSVGLVHSWDNIGKESNAWVLPDKLVVWNHIMKEQAVRFLGFGERDVFVAGVPQYSEYLHRTHIAAKSEYKALKGIPQDSKILTYACGNPGWYVDEESFIKDLIGLVSQRQFGDTVLLIRLHPQYNVERFKRVFGSYPGVFFDEGDESFAVRYSTKWPPQNSNSSYVSLLCHSDVVINLASTVTIDAVIFDRPVVNVAYDLKPVKGYWFSNARYYESEHYKHIVASGGVRVARSREELVRYITMYLEDPSVDREGRRRVAAEQCHNLDAKAGERVASFILSVAR